MLSANCSVISSEFGIYDEIYELRGDWQYREGRIADFAEGEASTGEWRTIEVPHRFRAAEDGQTEPAWVSLRRTLPESAAALLNAGRPVAFSSGLVSDVSRFYLNGRLFAGVGEVEPYRSGLYRRVFVVLPPAVASPDAGPIWELSVELYAPADRPLHFEGPEILIGSADALTAVHYYGELLFLALISGLVAISLFHLILAFQLTQERHHYYYSAFTLLWSIYMLFRIATRDVLFGDEVLLRVRVEYTALILTGPALILFLVSLFERRTSRLGMTLSVIALAVVGGVWFGDYPTMRLMLKIFHGFALPTIGVIAWIVVRGVRLRNPDAKPIALGMLLFLFFSVNDILSNLGWIPTPMIARFALPVLIGSTTVLLVGRIIRMYKYSVRLNSNLEETVAERTAELSEAIDKAQTANRAKSEFLANMSHEIRTPMNAVLGMADLLAEAELPQEEARYVDTLQRSGRSLLVLLNDILDVSRIEAGRLETERVLFSPRDNLQAVAEVFQVSAQNKGLRLDVSFESELPEFVFGDPHRLRQILTNLIGNAIKFTESGEVVLSLRALESDEQGRRILEYQVRDSGVGIDKEKLELVFEKFSQSDSSVTRQFGGTGLGLYITRSLVELLGGEIDVRSAAGEGTTFFVRLPFALAASETAPGAKSFSDQTGSAQPDSEPGPDSVGECRILLVDDTADNRMLFRAYMKRRSAAIDEARNGVEAVQMFQASLGLTGKRDDRPQPYDIVFMDIQMPEMDGLTATREIRACEAHIRRDRPGYAAVPIIALSAYAHQAERQRSLDSGCDEHVSKPFSKQQLYDILGKYVRNSPVSGKTS